MSPTTSFQIKLAIIQQRVLLKIGFFEVFEEFQKGFRKLGTKKQFTRTLNEENFVFNFMISSNLHNYVTG